MYNNTVYEHVWIETTLNEFSLTGEAEAAAKSLYGTNLVDKVDPELLTNALGQLVGENAK